MAIMAAEVLGLPSVTFANALTREIAAVAQRDYETERLPGGGAVQDASAWWGMVRELAYTGRRMRLFRAPYFGDAEPTTADELALAAILHDIGRPVLARLHPGYAERFDRRGATPDDRIAEERRELGIEVGLGLKAVSRLGDGAFWYALMAALAAGAIAIFMVVRDLIVFND